MEEKIPLYTDLEITPKGTVGLKKYFDSICRNLPNKWKLLRNEKYEDLDTFKLLEEIACLKTPWYRNTAKEITFFAKIFLGLTDTSIIILKIDSDSEIKRHDCIELIGYVNTCLHEEVLKPNKHYEAFNHKFLFGGPSDENWYKSDLRDQRQIRIYSKNDKNTYTLAKGTQADFGNTRVFFNEPNNISLALSLMKKSFKKAYNIYVRLNLLNSFGRVEIIDSDKSILYDYFEEIITSVTFSYIAIESLSNAAIPEDYKHEIINEKGVKEIWPKESIERWMSTSEKVSEILPKILKSKNIKEEEFWVKFKELEKLRNEIVHQKTIEKGTKLDSQIYKELINPDIFKIIKSSLSVIQFFYDLNNAHPYFPLGMGIATFQIDEIDSMEKHFKPI